MPSMHEATRTEWAGQIQSRRNTAVLHEQRTLTCPRTNPYIVDSVCYFLYAALHRSGARTTSGLLVCVKLGMRGG